MTAIDTSRREAPAQMTRLTHAWRALAPEQRLAALARSALFVTMFLPWYEAQSRREPRGRARSNRSNISAFGDVSFVEAAVLLVSAGVLAMLFARAEGRDFQLPGGDGSVMIAGGWAALLIFYRVFDKPGAGHGYRGRDRVGHLPRASCARRRLAYAGMRMRGERTPRAAADGRARRARPERRPEPSSRRRAPASAAPRAPAATARSRRSGAGATRQPPPAAMPRRPRSQAAGARAGPRVRSARAPLAALAPGPTEQLAPRGPASPAAPGLSLR